MAKKEENMEAVKPSISKIDIAFNREDLNALRDKINEVIEHICR